MSFNDCHWPLRMDDIEFHCDKQMVSWSHETRLLLAPRLRRWWIVLSVTSPGSSRTRSRLRLAASSRSDEEVTWNLFVSSWARIHFLLRVSPSLMHRWYHLRPEWANVSTRRLSAICQSAFIGLSVFGCEEGLGGWGSKEGGGVNVRNLYSNF